jgi:hypothetical protein
MRSPDRLGDQLVAALTELRAVALRHRYVMTILEGIDPLDAWSLCDELIEKLTGYENSLTSVAFDANLAERARRSPQRGAKAKALRDEILPLIAAWRVSLMSLRAGLKWRFGRRGLLQVADTIQHELDGQPPDREALELLLGRIAAAAPGDEVLLGDVAATAERILRNATLAAEGKEQRRQELLSSVQVLSEGDMSTATETARRADGTVDPFVLAAALALPLDDTLTSSDRYLRIQRRQQRVPGDDD